jgi:hypothetical protein
MRHALSMVTLLTTLFLAGCLGITQPSDSDIHDMTEQQFNQQLAGLFTATAVTKKNGYKDSDTHYIAEMHILATAQQSLDEYAAKLMQDKSLSAMEKFTHGMNLGLLKMTLPEFVTGDQVEFERNYLFIKTDNGWMLKKELQATDLSN